MRGEYDDGNLDFAERRIFTPRYAVQIDGKDSSSMAEINEIFVINH